MGVPVSIDRGGRPSPAPGYEFVQPELLDRYPELVRELGGDPDPLLRQAGIDSVALAAGRASATYRQLLGLLEATAARLHCSDFGMRLARCQQAAHAYGPLGQVMLSARTFGEALRYAVSHSYAHSLAAQIWTRKLPEHGMILCGHDILIDGVASHVQAIEQVLLIGSRGTSELTGGRSRARRVHFRHLPVAAPATYRRYFECDVLFEQHEDGLLFHQSDMASAIVGPPGPAVESAAELLERRFERHAPMVRAQVRGVVMRSLSRGECTNAFVAAQLGLQVRTLRRRLKDEGTSFQDIKDAVRRDTLLYYLRHTALPLGHISERLGYSEQTIMTRRCKRWFGASPRLVRQGLE